ncbi:MULTISPECIES: sigma factor-like helix-turn-helix DNA-binding protein [Paenibacillus]|uniref:sigma factor-like helix-turn-helix DNA-binding protein n=1 Tax=Paenibacillus TaxID=44249 RepID=UPI0035A2381B
MHCLTPKERKIFEACFFRQLSPEDIASMYQMTTGSIYTYIHLSRHKFRKEHARASLGILPPKQGFSLTKSSVLTLPDWPAQPSIKCRDQTLCVALLARRSIRWGSQAINAAGFVRLGTG